MYQQNPHFNQQQPPRPPQPPRTWWQRHGLTVLLVGLPLIFLIGGSILVLKVGRRIGNQIKNSQVLAQQIIQSSPALAPDDSTAFESTRSQLILCDGFRDTILPLLDTLEISSRVVVKELEFDMLSLRGGLDTVLNKKGANAPDLVNKGFLDNGNAARLKTKLVQYLEDQNAVRKLLPNDPYRPRPNDDFDFSTGSTDRWEHNVFDKMLAEDVLHQLDVYLLSVTERNRDLLVRVRDECAKH